MNASEWTISSSFVADYISLAVFRRKRIRRKKVRGFLRKQRQMRKVRKVTWYRWEIVK